MRIWIYICPNNSKAHLENIFINKKFINSTLNYEGYSSFEGVPSGRIIVWVNYLRVFHTNFDWWLFNQVWMIASLLRTLQSILDYFNSALVCIVSILSLILIFPRLFFRRLDDCFMSSNYNLYHHPYLFQNVLSVRRGICAILFFFKLVILLFYAYLLILWVFFKIQINLISL